MLYTFASINQYIFENLTNQVMVSKKLKLLFTLCMLVSASVIAQTGGSNGYMGGGYNVYDSSVIPNKKMGQQNEFWNNNYSFPAKPRNMWEVGVKTGIATISGDVPSVVLTAPNFGIHVRKSFGYIFSLRAEYINTINKGLQWKAADNFGKNEAWMDGGYFAQFRNNAGQMVTRNVSKTGVETYGNLNAPLRADKDIVFYNYKTNIQDLSLQGIFTVNNIRFHKQKTGIVIYGGGGVGITAFNAKVNAINEGAGGGLRSYKKLFDDTYTNNNVLGLYQSRKTITKALKAGMDNTYETDAESEISPKTTRPFLGKNTIKPSGTVLMGVAFKLGKRINLAIEDRWTFVKTDLLDGQRWQEHAVGDAVLTRDFDSYNFATIGLNVNLGAKSVQPLYWLNPLDYAYSELNTPRHMKLPKPVLNDGDGDGVIDQMDKEPNTPAGCPVDTHGVTKDTDGDGVPDCKDKQLITPTECQPVDADGIGKCPEPECCKNAKPSNAVSAGCPTDYPSLKGSMNGNNKAMLASVASKMKANAACTITMTAYCGTSKSAQKACQRNLDAAKAYLVEKEGISADRIMTATENADGSNENTIDIKSN
jgi:hypothetical protein